MMKISTEEDWSEFKRTGIIINYPHVDLIKKKVTATISIEEDVKMTVIVDLNLNVVSKNGNIDEILDILPDDDEEYYIEVIRYWAEMFINNNIADPKAYFDSLT
ncbi:hypothetical protein [Rummeliibacillus sp. SL167]|uniref:hypothetical protein n=1 Tax=Rummeliibacillus sp. SL167 TaxID=2579792 RepID=UPI0011B803A7|nr:hypothetical protein [Rummeliibacillus sp. SL167]